MAFQARTTEQLAEEAQRLRAEWPEGLPSRFSATAAGMIFTCPEQYRQRYVSKTRMPPNPNIIWGRADSQAIGGHFAAVIADGEGHTAEQIADDFNDCANEVVEDAGGVGEIQWDAKLSPDESGKAFGKLKDAGINLAQSYHHNVAPPVTPVDVEHEFEIEHELWPIPVVGYLDVLTPTDIIERKTAARKSTAPKTTWLLQGRIYQMAKRLPIHWHQSIKNLANPAKQVAYGSDPALTLAFDPVEAHRTEILVAQAMKEVEHFYSMYGPDQMWPGHGIIHPWACTFCDARPNCGWVR